MKAGTIQTVMAVVQTGETVSAEHAAEIRRAIENGGIIRLVVDGPMISISAAARAGGFSACQRLPAATARAADIGQATEAGLDACPTIELQTLRWLT